MTSRATRTSGRCLISVCLPFPLAGQPFHRSTSSILNNFSMHHRHLQDGRFVSAPLPRLSPYAFTDVAILRVGGVSSSLDSKARKPPTNTPAKKHKMQTCAIRITHTKCPSTNSYISDETGFSKKHLLVFLSVHEDVPRS